ncbi:hypothetical protein JCM11641_007024 [Rhodosporidiobolus odoratus]
MTSAPVEESKWTKWFSRNGQGETNDSEAAKGGLGTSDTPDAQAEGGLRDDRQLAVKNAGGETRSGGGLAGSEGNGILGTLDAFCLSGVMELNIHMPAATGPSLRLWAHGESTAFSPATNVGELPPDRLVYPLVWQAWQSTQDAHQSLEQGFREPLGGLRAPSPKQYFAADLFGPRT